MKVKFILPALTEAKSPFWRPIKYSLFSPLGLATLAAFLGPAEEAELVDDHVELLRTDDAPDLVVIQVYITDAYRAYALAGRRAVSWSWAGCMSGRSPTRRRPTPTSTSSARASKPFRSS